MKKLAYIAMTMVTLAVPSVGRADESRLNLWPLIGYEDGALDVIWPLGHFKSAGDWRFFPLIRDHDLFAVFPELWITRHSFALLPLYSRYDMKSGTLFPVLWWNCWQKNDVLHSVFPLYYYHSCDNGTTFWACCGLGGFRRSIDATAAHWLLPAYLKNSHGFYSIPYSNYRTRNGNCETLLLGLAGRGCDDAGEMKSNWCFPLWYRDQSALVTLPLVLEWNGEDRLNRWLSLPILSGAWQKGDMWNERYLIALAGRGVNEKSGFRQSWLAPLYYADSDGTLVTPLYGHTKTSRWCFPLWYNDEHSFYSPFWCQSRDTAGEVDFWAAPPLLSGFAADADGTKNAYALCGLAGASWGGRKPRSSWMFPLYYEDSDGTFVTAVAGKKGDDSNWILPLYYYDGWTEEFLSLPYGHINKGSHTNTWWATPLIGTYSGSKTGGWFFPFFNRQEDAAYSRDLARLDADEIPEDIQIRRDVYSMTNSTGKVDVWTNLEASVEVRSKRSGSVLLGADNDSRISGSTFETSGIGKYQLLAHSKHGNRLLFNHDTSRSVTFDVDSRGKIGETRKSEIMALCGLFWREHTENNVVETRRLRSHLRNKVPPLPVGTNTHTRVLWKLWDREEKDGNVKIDAFPGFTYDSRTNGYSKTSLLWRLFRYERDPAEGTKLDLLYIPVIR